VAVATVAARAPTRERLLVAARDLIGEGGYGAASVAAVAQRAGVATGALYRHFPSKADLFVEVFRAVCERELDAARAAAAALGPEGRAIDRVEAILATFAERALRNRHLAWALLAEPVDTLVDAERLVYRRRYRDLLAGALRDGIETGELPPQDASLSAAALVGGVGEALAGPLARREAGGREAKATLDALRAFARRAVGG
jgi:AcrR family transcriptional regulator